MILTHNTFTTGMKTLSLNYPDWKFNRNDGEAMTVWYSQLRKKISEEDFLSVVNHYCDTMETAPSSPLSLKMTYVKNHLNSPSPAVVAHALVSAERRMLHSDFMYEDPTVEQQKEYLLSDIVMHYPAFRDNHVYTVVVTLADSFYEVLSDTVRRNDTTEVSILVSDLKSAYRKAVDKSVSHMVIAGGLLESNSPLLLE